MTSTGFGLALSCTLANPPENSETFWCLGAGLGRGGGGGRSGEAPYSGTGNSDAEVVFPNCRQTEHVQLPECEEVCGYL